MYSKINGATFIDGAKDIINTLNVGDELALLREPDNPFDSLAVAILHNTKIGYLPRNTAFLISELLDNGILVKCVVDEITGKDKPNQGCNIIMRWSDDDDDE